MKKLALILALVPFLAFAGKREREYMKTEVLPAQAAGQEAFKAACGCALKITIDDKTIVTEDDMYQVKHICNSIKDGAAGHCTDDASKKAMCALKEVHVTKTKQTEFKWDDKKGRGIASTDGQSYTSFDMMTAAVDK